MSLLRFLSDGGFPPSWTSATSSLKVGITAILAITHYVIPTERSDEESASAPAFTGPRSLENRRL